ncbi:kinase-like protein, partial [Exidia glandulosa HHB12029]
GFGSHGTIVYQGAFQGRAVAVKRLLGDFVTLATREVQLLQESDDHPNVIRYFYKEQRDNFLYIALELCPASLADVVERPDVFRDISIAFDPKKALSQVTAGLRHLHSLKIVHRDIKPQNILVSHAKNGVRRMLISDFGLCKKLDSDQTSFMPTMHGAMAAGTVGWRAPEILRGDRLTKSVDVFALGCLFYYTLTNGDHPYGDRFNRERNIMKNEFRLDELERLGEEGVEAMDLISKMLDPEPKARPDTLAILLHPFFWTPGRRLNFLQDASDRFEIMCRAPREQPLIVLETGAYDVVGADWHSRLDRIFIENLGKFRKYDGKAVQDLLRALRNKKHHYQDLPDHVKRHVGSMPDGFLAYFTRRFPALFLHVHTVVSDTGLDREPMFRSYFELAES